MNTAWKPEFESLADGINEQLQQVDEATLSLSRGLGKETDQRAQDEFQSGLFMGIIISVSGTFLCIVIFYLMTRSVVYP